LSTGCKYLLEKLIVRIITNVQERDQPITKDDKNY